MDQKWEPSWHVFLGKSFGCHAVHEKNRFVYFTFEQSKISFLIYKASWAEIKKNVMKIWEFSLEAMLNNNQYKANRCGHQLTQTLLIEICDKAMSVALIMPIHSYKLFDVC